MIWSLQFTKGGDGPKLLELLQMREKYLLQDRMELLGPIRHKDVLSVRHPLTTDMQHQ